MTEAAALPYKLYSYFRSSCAYRVRIALNIKNIPYEIVPVHLLNNGGEQHAPEYVDINPMHAVPTLVTPSGQILTQSMAIIEYIDDTHRMPRLMPDAFIARAYVREIAQTIGCDIHPLNNLRVLQKLEQDFGMTDAQKTDWIQDWIRRGFTALENLITRSPHYTGLYACGDDVTSADLAIVSQVYNALRYKIDMDDFPLLSDIYNGCMELEPFIKASPEMQPDCPPDLKG